MFFFFFKTIIKNWNKISQKFKKDEIDQEEQWLFKTVQMLIKKLQPPSQICIAADMNTNFVISG